MSWHYSIPPIYTEKNFFYVTQIKKGEFLEISLQKNAHYKIGRQLKKSGGYRIIYKPDNELKKILKLVYKNYLVKISLPTFVHCGVRNRSISTSVQGHNKFTYHKSLDIAAFFDKVTVFTLQDSLIAAGLPSVVVTKILELCTEDNHLPQGFPTSSFLSSLVLCVALEETVLSLRDMGIKFSAYADDILISSNQAESLNLGEKLIKEALEKVGLSLNDKKQTWDKISNETTLGINLHPFPRINRIKIKQLQKALYDNKKNKLTETELKVIRGKISFYSSVNKNKLTQKVKKAVGEQIKNS